MNQLILHNRQRIRPVRLKLFRSIILSTLQEDLHVDSFELGVTLVGPRTMARLNQKHLHHQGPTDVITFDYSTPAKTPAPRQSPRSRIPFSPAIQGEIFICLSLALQQAQVFQTSWQSELTRYALHGLLHLVGYDDMNTKDRRVMKARENRLLSRATARFSLLQLGP